MSTGVAVARSSTKTISPAGAAAPRQPAPAAVERQRGRQGDGHQQRATPAHRYFSVRALAVTIQTFFDGGQSELPQAVVAKAAMRLIVASDALSAAWPSRP